MDKELNQLTINKLRIYTRKDEMIRMDKLTRGIDCHPHEALKYTEWLEITSMIYQGSGIEASKSKENTDDGRVEKFITR